MGLDLVDVFLAVEDEFGVQIPVAGELPETVRELHAQIELQLKRNVTWSGSWCRCIPAFLHVRNALRKSFDVACRIRPSSRLDDFLPVGHRREAWMSLEALIAARLPSLTAGRRGEVAIFLAWLGTTALMTITGLLTADALGLLFATLIGLPMVTIASLMLHQRCCVLLPANCTTVRDLVYHSLPKGTADEIGRWNDQYSWNRLLQIISDRLDVPLKEIRAESHFVKDLRCG